jgi:hypothetical protein
VRGRVDPIARPFPTLRARERVEFFATRAREGIKTPSRPISDAKNILQELRAIVPELPSVPVQPVIIASQEEPGMFDFYRGFRSFLPVHRYHTPAQLLLELSDRVIEPSEAKALEFRAITVQSSPT